jgi:ATP-dependent RNA helicase RhlE
MSFATLNLLPSLLKALEQEGYTEPTPIQAKAIPVILEGKDIIAAAQTGTGKTAAFALPILQFLTQEETAYQEKRVIKSLILTPTRELAAQISESFRSYGRYTSIRNITIYGGVSQRPQESALRSGAQVLIATPGRLLDLIQQRLVNLSKVKLFVLDEADRMLDMGFINDVKKIITYLPAKKQTLFFSATMPSEIARLAKDILVNPVGVSVAPISSTAEKIDQSLYFVEKNNKKQLLLHLLKTDNITNALIFTRTKHGADRVVKDIATAGIHAEAIHGNKSQQARLKALHNFKTGKTKILVATDIAARGIDVEELSHVINYELPNIAETYVHRIGRTGRAGRSGIALSFCDAEERAYLRDIHRLLTKNIPVIEQHPFQSNVAQFNKREEQRKPYRNPYQENRTFSKNPHRNFRRSPGLKTSVN